MKKRLLACVLSCLLLLHLSVPALASSMSDDGIYYVEDADLLPPPADYVDYFETVPDDIIVNPEDYVLNAGVSGSSLGLTLTMGQIAALIAGGVGTVYLASNWDALGSHLQTALNDAANLNGGAAALTYWLENARQGVIALTSAPAWITQTILNVCYNIHQSISLPTGSPFEGYAPAHTGTIVPAGTPIYYGAPNLDDNGKFYRTDYVVFDCDVVPFIFVSPLYKQSYYYKFDTTVFFMKTDAGRTGTGKRFGIYTSDILFTDTSVSNCRSYTCDATGVTRYIYRLSISSGYTNTWSPTTAFDNAFNTYILPGSYLIDNPTANNSAATLFFTTSIVQQLFEEYLSTGAVAGVGAYPVGESVCPDALVGGISQAWTDGTLDAGVIDLPDILIDGSGVITGTDTATLDTSISTTLDKVATGQLAWDDYWLDISNSVPIAKVEDTTTGDVVNRPIAPDGTLQDPVVVPDYSTDLNDYTLDLKGIFPFCIPFDIYEFLSCLAADPEAPSWTWSLPFGSDSFSFDVDLAPFDGVAQIFRNFELLLFIVGLGLKTRDLIKG